MKADECLFIDDTDENIEVARSMGISVIMKDQYYNMREKIEPDHMFLVDNEKRYMKELGIEPKIQPIRGGTDGAAFSYMGIPCPNLCTGGHNYHGRFEYCYLESMEDIVKLLIKLTEELK